MAAINFPDSPSLNQKYTDKGFTFKWNGSVWISVGISTTRISNIREIDDISSSFNGSTTQFPTKVSGIDVTAVTAQQLLVSLGGVMQNPEKDFTLSGANIVFSTAPANGLDFWAVILGTDVSLNTIADASVSPAKLTGGGPNWSADGTVGITSGVTIVGVTTIGGVTKVTDATQSTSKDTGSLVIEGGLGLEGNIHAGGNLTAVNGTFSGDVSIGGTLTKQDVTNVDSVGVVTARTGIKVLAGGIDAVGITSVSAGAAGTVTIGYGNTTLIVDGGARVLGILTVGTSSLTLDGTNNKVNVGSGVTVDATGYRIGNDTFLHATGAALPFLNVAGVTTSTGGFMIGITSGATNITNGPIKTLNFVGAGNTFNVTGTTVDISIAGGGGGGSSGKSSYFSASSGGVTIRTI